MIQLGGKDTRHKKNCKRELAGSRHRQCPESSRHWQCPEGSTRDGSADHGQMEAVSSMRKCLFVGNTIKGCRIQNSSKCPGASWGHPPEILDLVLARGTQEMVSNVLLGGQESSGWQKEGEMLGQLRQVAGGD